MTRLDPRLQKLEVRRPVGCSTCRHWCGTVLVDDEGVRSRPGCCPACGRLVPIRVVLRIVGVALEAV